MSKFTEWLENVMFERGGRKYGPTALARDLGIRSATVTEWSTVGRVPDRTMIHALAIHFGTTSRHIYELLGEKPPEGLNDDKELMMGQVEQMYRNGVPDETVKLFMSKNAKGGLSPAVREAITRALLDVMEKENEPVKPKRKRHAPDTE